MLQIGFIGLGGMGMHQVKSFDQAGGCRIAAGADVSPKARAGFARQFPAAEIFTDYRRLAANPKIDAVVIAVPTGLHFQAASHALRRGKPVLLEKPMARTVSQCRRLNDLAAKTGNLLMVAQCRRFDPYWLSWGNAVRKGRIGLPVLWRHVMAGLGPGRWFMDDKLGGGPLLDGAVHNYDFANLIFGDPESVVASSIRLVSGVTATDTASAVVRYRSGSQLLVSWSWGTRGLGVHDIVGPKGFVQFGTGGLKPSAKDKKKYNYCCVTNLKGKESLLKSVMDPPMVVRQARHFLACVKSGKKCESPGTEAIKAVAVAEAILKAGASGRALAVKW